MLKIEIFKEDIKSTPRTMPGKDGKPPRTIYEQDAYVFLEGRFPTLTKVQLEEGQPPYQAGLYTFHASSYIVNHFNTVELKKYGKMIVPMEPEL
ncbi:single-stranded DNA-binding protein [Vibrio tapetis]|uniref:Single-stranded DNA-binding protein n=1 Tax=Vibrio tapetis subsp. tapetis TaxID=1671868 RepID=A0A2N8ZLC7_9VIBR|nr:single-stranded DNA-binding protein [Vibrio tapetis]SON52710.1 RstB1 protein [Vibrio tapetis subsp. tapetis]